MFSHAIMLAMLTYPLHVLLFGVILSRLAREAVSGAGPGGVPCGVPR
jgi:hypothetical protein